MSEEHLSQRLREIAEHEVPGDLDLWQAIRADITADALPRPRRSMTSRVASRMRIFRSRTPVLVALSLVVLVVAFGVVTAPSAQGRIDGMLRRFGLMLVSSTTVTPATPQWPGQTKEPALANGGPIQMTSIGEAQRRAPFPIHLPRLLPEGMTMRDVYIRTSPPTDPNGSLFTVEMTYSTGDERVMFIRETRGASEGAGVPESQVQDARINGRSALYAQGGWEFDGDSGSSLRWDETLNRQLLSWESGGVTYVVDAYGLDLRREDMIRIAESIQ